MQGRSPDHSQPREEMFNPTHVRSNHRALLPFLLAAQLIRDSTQVLATDPTGAPRPTHLCIFQHPSFLSSSLLLFFLSLSFLSCPRRRVVTNHSVHATGHAPQGISPKHTQQPCLESGCPPALVSRSITPMALLISTLLSAHPAQTTCSAPPALSPWPLIQH